MRAIVLLAVVVASLSYVHAKHCPPGYASRAQIYPGVPARWWWTLPLKHRRY